MGPTQEKRQWEEAYNNRLVSGIEVRDKNGKLTNFITIKHDEILEKESAHRIAISMNENSELQLPPPQTFEEIIQAKRRYQMLLYGTGNSSSSTSTGQLASRARQAAARQVVAAASRAAQRPSGSTSMASQRRQASSSTTSSGAASRSRSGKSKSKRKRPTAASAAATCTPVPEAEEAPAMATTTSDHMAPMLDGVGVGCDEGAGDDHRLGREACKMELGEINHDQQPQPHPQPPPGVHATQMISQHQVKPKPASSEPNHSPPRLAPIFDPAPGTSSPEVITSMRDLTKRKDIVDKMSDSLKSLLKRAAPGEVITLPDGLIYTKSRRGGARKGAGRKRSRPTPGGSSTSTPHSSNSTVSNGPSHQQRPESTTNSSFSSSNA